MNARLIAWNLPRFFAVLFASAYVGGTVQGVVSSTVDPLSPDWVLLAIQWGIFTAIGGTLIALFHFLPASILYLALLARANRDLAVPQTVVLGGSVFAAAYLAFVLLLAVASGQPSSLDWPTVLATMIWTSVIPGLLCGLVVRVPRSSV